MATRRRREQPRLLSASFSGSATGRSQSAPRGAVRVSAPQRKEGATTKAPPQQQQKASKAASSSLLGVVDLEEELAAFERRLRQARENFDLPFAAAASGGAGADAGGKAGKARTTKATTKPAGGKKDKEKAKAAAAAAAAAAKPRAYSSDGDVRAELLLQEDVQDGEEEDFLLPFSASAASFSASASDPAPLAATMPARLKARLSQSTGGTGPVARGSTTTARLAASMGAAPSRPPPLAVKKQQKQQRAAGAHDGKQDVGGAKSAETFFSSAASAPPKPKPVAVSAEEALLQAVLELDEQWEQGLVGASGREREEAGEPLLVRICFVPLFEPRTALSGSLTHSKPDTHRRARPRPWPWGAHSSCGGSISSSSSSSSSRTAKGGPAMPQPTCSCASVPACYGVWGVCSGATPAWRRASGGSRRRWGPLPCRWRRPLVDGSACR